MIGVKRYKDDLKAEVQRRIAAEKERVEVLARAEKAEAALTDERAKPRDVQTVTEKVEVPVEVVRIAAPANIASGLVGTNAQKIAALEAIIGTLQERLKAADLEWEV